MIVGKFYPELSGGNLQCKKIVDSLKHDFDFKILTFTNSNKKFLKENKEYDILRIQLKNNFYKIFKIIYFFLLNHKNFSIVHIFGISRLNILIILLSKIFNKKIVVKFSSFGEDDLESIYNKSKLNFILHKFFCNKLISIAPIFKKKCIKFNVEKKKNLLINNFFLAEQSKRFKNNSLIKSKGLKNVLCVGHFSKDKRNYFAFQIWKEVFLKGFKSNIIFVGMSNSQNYEVDIKIKQRIKNEAKNSNLIKYVRFINFEKEMNKIYKHCDILLMPSVREGVPNALIESIYFGLNCLCSKLPSIENFLKYRNLKFINVRSKKSIWCNELIKLLAKSTKKKLNNSIISNFNNKKITENYLKLYKNL
jgi:glycosyltransferase involved in cell wall biosynthesis